MTQLVILSFTIVSGVKVYYLVLEIFRNIVFFLHELKDSRNRLFYIRCILFRWTMMTILMTIIILLTFSFI